MCEQCCTDAVFYALKRDGTIEDVLPGWHLMRAQQDGVKLKKDDWGLVRCNDPDFYWSIPPFPDPLEGLDDDEADKATVEEKERSLEFYSAVEVFELALKCEPELGYDLVSSAMKAGYDRQKHGRFSFWLFDHLGRWTITHQPIHHGDERLAVQ